MAKKDKTNSEISESGTLSLDVTAHEKAVERKAWTGGGGGSLPDVGDYDAKIIALTRSVSKGEKTAGAPNFRAEMEIADGAFAGSKLNVFATAFPTTAQRYYNFLEGVMGIDTTELPVVNGKVQIPLPSEKDLREFVGNVVRVHVDHEPRNDGSKNADGTPRMGTRCSFALEEDGAAPAKKSKKAKKGASGIAE